MVKKLKLPTENHPNSYKVAWLRKKAEIFITKRCFINFSIGINIYIQHGGIWCQWMLHMYYLKGLGCGKLMGHIIQDPTLAPFDKKKITPKLLEESALENKAK